ncbi:MAG: MFS transporter [Proteobacteria bacterium]|nr:MFS transporter [Pseudomonadota bacterium]
MTAPTGVTAAYRRRVVLLLMGAYAFNAADRGVIGIVGQAMKQDLRLTDTQLGLLAGTAFAALYALSGIPTARLAERCSRIRILSLALAAWSALTAAGALTGSFVQLLLVRVGVGVAEAGCSPAAHSLISDYYDRDQRTAALSVYSCGLSLGYLCVSLLGGYATLHYGWRTALLAVGLPGVAYALLLRATVAEPPRRHGAPPPPFAWRAELAELAGAGRALFLRWPAANVLAGFVLSSFASYGTYAFLPPYFYRAFGLDYAAIGVVIGVVGSIPVALGILAGGVLTARLGGGNPRWYALLPALGLLLTTPVYLAALLQPRWQAAAVLLGLAGLLQYLALGPSFGIVQNVVPGRQRATAAALVFLALNVLALGGGALVTGMLIDHAAQLRFAALGGGLFAGACPGGSPPAGAPAALASACRGALVQGTRAGLMLSVAVHAWAALHYLAGSFGLAAQLRAAAAADQPAVSSR